MAPARRLAALCFPCALLALVLSVGGARARKSHRRHPAHAQRPLRRPTWLSGVEVTEYYPAPEAWFVGRRVDAPGLAHRHRADWLYSARGVSMEGDGVTLDGQAVHIESLGRAGWINDHARATRPRGHAAWDRGSPIWRAGAYWLTRSRQLTFPLEAGGWSNGPGVRYVPLPGVRFAPGPSRPLTYYRSVAVDPRLIPLGSRVYIPAYRSITRSHGWFVAQDTGGAIIGHHLDVYRPPPPSMTDPGRFLSGLRVYVIPPGTSGRPAGSAAPGGGSGPSAPAGSSGGGASPGGAPPARGSAGGAASPGP